MADIAVHVGELKQLFHSLDPTPFRERDLDPKAEEFIAGWARELPADAPLAALKKAIAEIRARQKAGQPLTPHQ